MWKNSFAINMNILSIEQIRHLIKACKEKFYWACPIVYISLSTGTSVPEILALTWREVDFQEQTI